MRRSRQVCGGTLCVVWWSGKESTRHRSATIGTASSGEGGRASALLEAGAGGAGRDQRSSKRVSAERAATEGTTAIRTDEVVGTSGTAHGDSGAPKGGTRRLRVRRDLAESIAAQSFPDVTMHTQETRAYRPYGHGAAPGARQCRGLPAHAVSARGRECSYRRPPVMPSTVFTMSGTATSMRTMPGSPAVIVARL